MTQPNADVTRDETAPAARLFLDQEQWERLPERLDDPYFKRIAEINPEAMQFVEEKLWDGTSGAMSPRQAVQDRHVWQRWRWLKARLQRNVVAWYLHKDPACLERCRHTLQCLLQPGLWGVKWGPPVNEHFDLRMGELTFCVVFGLDTLGQYLDEEMRTALRRVLVDTSLHHYEAGLEQAEWWRYANFNWGTATHADAGLAALMVEAEHPELAARVLHRVRDGLAYVIEALPAEGGWTEGMMYMVTMLGHLTDFVAALDRVKGDDLNLSNNRRLIAALDYRPYMIGGDGMPINFSNIFADSSQYCFPQGYWWAAKCGRPEWAGFEDDHVKPWTGQGLFHDVEAFWYRRPFQASRKPALDRLRHFRGLDWFKWTGDRMWLAFRGGNNGGNHNNRDLGHFVLGAGADRFLIDPGYGASSTAQHNAVTVRGGDQVIDADAPIFRVRRFRQGFYLACDLTAVSPHAMAFFTRHLLLVDDAHLLVIDDVRGCRGKRAGVKVHLQTRMPYAADGDTVTLQGETGALHVHRLTPVTPVEAKHWEWKGRPVTTLSWSPAADLVQVTHAMLLSLAPVDFDLEIKQPEADLTVAGKTWRIDLAEAAVCGPEPCL